MSYHSTYILRGIKLKKKNNKNNRTKKIGQATSGLGCPGKYFFFQLVSLLIFSDCQNPIDLAFVLDSSGSVSHANFQLGLQFIIKVCEYFDIGYPHGTRVAVIRYSSAASILIRFNTYINKEDVLNAIRAITRQVGSTRTDLALLLANRELFNDSDNGVRPKDLGVPRVLVLLTDGRSTSGIKKVFEQSNLLRQEGVNIFAMGIGRTINKDELNIIASDPDIDHVFCPKTYAEINSMVEKMREASCYGEYYFMVFSYTTVIFKIPIGPRYSFH